MSTSSWVIETDMSRNFLVRLKNLPKNKRETHKTRTSHKQQVQTHSLHSALSEGLWNASESIARAVLCRTFTPSKKNMSQTLRTDGQGRVLSAETSERKT